MRVTLKNASNVTNMSRIIEYALGRRHFVHLYFTQTWSFYCTIHFYTFKKNCTKSRILNIFSKASVKQFAIYFFKQNLKAWELFCFVAGMGQSDYIHIALLAVQLHFCHLLFLLFQIYNERFEAEKAGYNLKMEVYRKRREASSSDQAFNSVLTSPTHQLSNHLGSNYEYEDSFDC